jgi:beta-glucosidase
MTFPRGEDQGPDATPEHFPGVDGAVSYAEGLNVGYRYYDAAGQEPLFPFGFGLSYSRFRAGPWRLTRGAGGGWHVEGSVQNVGPRAGADVVELYLKFPPAAGEPPWQLREFKRIELAGGERRAVGFDIDRRALSVWDEDSHAWRVTPGRYWMGIGSSSRDIEQRVSWVE